MNTEREPNDIIQEIIEDVDAPLLPVPASPGQEEAPVPQEPPAPAAQPAEAQPAEDPPAEAPPAEQPRDLRTTLPPEQVKCALHDGIAVFGVSLRGRSHLKSGAPCQDSNDFLYLPQEKILIAAIADGVGSCALSHWGAHVAVQEAIQSVRDSIVHLAQGSVLRLANLTGEQVGDVFNKAFARAQKSVEDFADAHEQSVVHLQSTLTVAIYDGSRMACCHIGDDGIVAQGTSGKYQMVTKRIKGEEANSVFTLQSGKWYMTNVSTDLTGFMMSTDGILDHYVTNEGSGNRVYYPFLERFLYGMKPENTNELAQIVEKNMERSIAYLSGDPEMEPVSDDMTILVVANQQYLCEAAKPTFSQAQWDAENQRIRNEIRAALEKNRTNYVTRHQTKPYDKEPQQTTAPHSTQGYQVNYQNRGQGNQPYGQNIPQYGQGTMQYGQGTMQYGQNTPQYGQGTTQYGQGTMQYGQGAPQYGQGAPQYGQGAPQYGQGTTQYGQNTPQYGQGNQPYDPDQQRKAAKSQKREQKEKGNWGFDALQKGKEAVGIIVYTVGEGFGDIAEGIGGIVKVKIFEPGLPDEGDKHYACPKCGNWVHNSKKRCSACHCKMIYKCPKCGKPIHIYDAQCGHCGQKLRWGST